MSDYQTNSRIGAALCVILAGMPLLAQRPPDLPRGNAIGLYYETWFTPGVKSNILNGDWATTEAIPLLGRYSSHDGHVLEQHARWFAWLGIDFLGVDWTNNLFDRENPWENHRGNQLELIETTRLLLKTLTRLRHQGIATPRVTLLLGLENGASATVPRLNNEIQWVYDHYVRSAELNESLAYVDGKPLLILFRGAGCGAPPGIEAGRFTVRWMSHQLQTRKPQTCGLWSWMDGVVDPVVTRYQGKAEAVTVTPAFFPLIGPTKGWLDPKAMGRRNGATYLAEWNVALKARPQFLLINQWNEFAGQKDGEGYGPKKDGYGDTYSIELSDDIEPTKLNGCGYRGCGGWGYYYLNLTKALMELYRGKTPDATLVVLSSPLNGSSVPAGDVNVGWTVTGAPAKSFRLFLDRKAIVQDYRGDHYILPATAVRSGKHTLTIEASGTKSYFDLDYEKLAEQRKTPVEASSTVHFSAKEVR
jgi:hypothetical protein